MRKIFKQRNRTFRIESRHDKIIDQPRETTKKSS